MYLSSNYCATLIVVAMTTTAKPKGKRKAPKAQSLRRRAKKALTQSLAVVRRLPWWADVLTVVLFVCGIYESRHALVPEIRPDAAISSSWADLPITVRNSGELFNLSDAQFFCEVTNITWKVESAGPPGTLTAFRAVGILEYKVPQKRTIAPGTAVTFSCDISSSLTARYPNGTQWPVALIHMTIKTKYNINLRLLHWHRESTSQLFTWREVSGGFQWLEGDSSDTIKRN